MLKRKSILLALIVALVSAQIFAGFHNAVHAMSDLHSIEVSHASHDKDHQDQKTSLNHDCQLCVNTQQLFSGLDAQAFLLVAEKAAPQYHFWSAKAYDKKAYILYCTRAPPHVS